MGGLSKKLVLTTVRNLIEVFEICLKHSDTENPCIFKHNIVIGNDCLLRIKATDENVRSFCKFWGKKILNEVKFILKHIPQFGFYCILFKINEMASIYCPTKMMLLIQLR